MEPLGIGGMRVAVLLHTDHLRPLADWPDLFNGVTR